MKIPRRLQPLVEDGLVDAVVRQLMSGKEAMVFIVRCGDEIRCAKVYKEANKRSFRQAVDYTEGRKTKNSRKARAMEKGTRYGRKVQEEAWQSAEVDALYRLAAAGVRVPTPYNFHEGVLLMELVTDAEGRSGAAAQRSSTSPKTKRCTHHHTLDDGSRAHAVRRRRARRSLRIQRAPRRSKARSSSICRKPSMPRATTTPAACWNAMSAISRRFSAGSRRSFSTTDYGKEIWSLYEDGALHPEVELTGRFERTFEPVDLDSVMLEIDDARAEDAARRLRQH